MVKKRYIGVPVVHIDQRFGLCVAYKLANFAIIFTLQIQSRNIMFNSKLNLICLFLFIFGVTMKIWSLILDLTLLLLNQIPPSRRLLALLPFHKKAYQSPTIPPPFKLPLLFMDQVNRQRKYEQWITTQENTARHLPLQKKDSSRHCHEILP